jgi:hypothetical protein
MSVFVCFLFLFLLFNSVVVVTLYFWFATILLVK